MVRNDKSIPANGMVILLLVLISAIAMEHGFTGDERWYFVLIVSVPLIVLAIVKNKIAGKRGKARVLPPTPHTRAEQVLQEERSIYVQQ